MSFTHQAIQSATNCIVPHSYQQLLLLLLFWWILFFWNRSSSCFYSFFVGWPRPLLNHRPFQYDVCSHSVTCHPTQALTRASKLVQWYSIYLPRRDGRLSWPIGYTAMYRRESNSRSLDHKSDALTTTPPIRLPVCGMCGNAVLQNSFHRN